MAEKSRREQLKGAVSLARGLVQAVAPERHVEEEKVEKSTTPPATPPSSRGTALVPTTRQRSEYDDQWLEFIAGVVERDREIRQGVHGDPFRPELLKHGTEFKIADPFYDLLDGQYRSYGEQFIYLTVEQQQKALNAGGHYPWRSRCLMTVLQKGLSELWCRPSACATCGEPFTDLVSYSFVSAVLWENILLPDATFPPEPEGGWSRREGRPKPKWLMHAYHNECVICHTLRERIVDTETELQKLPEGTQEATAARTQAIINMLAGVATDCGVELAQVKVRFRRILDSKSTSTQKGGRRATR